MGRLRIVPYKMGSKSGKELAKYLECKRLFNDGRSNFVGRRGDVIINWGNSSSCVVGSNFTYLNHPRCVALSSNKLKSFQKFNAEGISIPEFALSIRDVEDQAPSSVWVARTKLSGHSGDGIVIGTPDELPVAPLYTKYIEKTAEFRAIVVGESVVDFKQKKKRSSPRDEQGEIIEAERIEHDPHVWNLDGGYVFVRGAVLRPGGIDELAVSAVKALGLDFGAVDIIQDSEGTLYVLEVNTAFGLDGTTIELVGEAIKNELPNNS